MFQHIARFGLILVLLAIPQALRAADATLSAVNELPKGTPAQIAKHLDPNGYSVTGADGGVCSVWFVKDAAVKSGFSPTLAVKYPFTNGQLLGLLQVVQKEQFTDFRGQEVKPGVYTLRYGLQPQDGNHIGTSQVRDFLLAIPAADDKSPAVISDETTLVDESAKTAGSAHPAIYALQQIEKAPDKPSLYHDENSDHWAIRAAVRGKAGGKEVKVPVQLVVIGQSEG